MNRKTIATTDQQRQKLRNLFPGVGMIAYKSHNRETIEAEFYTDPRGQLRYIKSGQPLEMEIIVDGRRRVVQITSQFVNHD